MPTEYEKRRNERRLQRKAEEAKRVLAKEGVADDAATLRPGWYDKGSTAAYFGTSVSQIEKWIQRGMPHAKIGARTKFKPRECEAWLEKHDLLERRGERHERALLALRDQIARAEGLLIDEDLELPEERASEISRLLEQARWKVEAERGDR